jgi:hypothetical protein
MAWVQDAWARIRPFSTGGNYVNMQTADDDAARTADAYGANYQRLQQVKADYDPDNLFRINRNIPRRPDGQSTSANTTEAGSGVSSRQESPDPSLRLTHNANAVETRPRSASAPTSQQERNDH